MHVHIVDCVRCGGEHDNECTPVQDAEDDQRWITTCPVTGQIIVVRMDHDAE